MTSPFSNNKLSIIVPAAGDIPEDSLLTSHGNDSSFLNIGSALAIERIASSVSNIKASNIIQAFVRIVKVYTG